MGHARSRRRPIEARPSPPASASAPPPLAEQMFAEAVRRHAAGERDAPEALYGAVLALRPDHAQASYNLGLILHLAGRLEEAVAAYRRAIALRPDYVDAHGNLAVTLQDLRRTDEALAVYRHVLAIQPDFALAMCNMGVTLKAQGRLDEAVAAYRRAIAIKPDYDQAYANLAAALLDQGDAEAAIVACERAIAIRPSAEAPRFNLGTAYKALSRLPEAEAAFRGALALRSDFNEAHFSLGQTLLTAGNFTEGWAEYDWRWKLAEYGWLKSLHGDFAQPRWTGQDIAGKTILVYAEQGMGDTIHFVRYIPLLVRRGAKVALAAHPPLVNLLRGMEGVSVIPLDAKVLPPFDAHCPLLSLPRGFGTTLESIPGDTPYLRADPALAMRWRERLPEGDRLRVGVVWAGNPTQTGDRFRSPRLAAVRPLLDAPGVAFVGLQVGPGRDDLTHCPLPAGMLDLGGDIGGFTDTAAIMSGLDLVISSCTAPLHLAGALNIPTWGMIPFAPHFPWLLDRSDSPWYPSVRLYRQDRPGADWSAVVGRIAGDLARMVAARGL